MSRFRRFLALLAASVMALTLTGCVVSSAEELYSLPALPEEYLQLQELIDQRISEGGEYAAPTGGSYRQSIQLQDLDGDGTEEALAFLADRSHTPSICVYRRDDSGSYYLYVIIDGAGSAVSSIEYADLTGDGAAELIVAWQISGDMRLLAVYTLSAQSQERLISVDCSEFLVCDMDGDGTEDLVDLHTGVSDPGVELYTFDRDGTATSRSAPLSDGVSAVRRMRPGDLSDGQQALFVESSREDELVTDVFTASDTALTNITMTAAGHSDTLRHRSVFAADINGDGAMEIPAWYGDLLQWFSLNSSGAKHIVMTTYHNYDDGWYLVLDGLLNQDVTIQRGSSTVGERSVSFTLPGSGAEPPRTVLILYYLTGENRLDRAESEGRFILYQDESSVYAAQILDDTVTQEGVMNAFHVIYAEWQAGDL